MKKLKQTSSLTLGYYRASTSLSSASNITSLHPHFVSGFSDGEAYFSIGITKRSNGWIPSPMFGI